MKNQASRETMRRHARKLREEVRINPERANERLFRVFASVSIPVRVEFGAVQSFGKGVRYVS